MVADDNIIGQTCPRCGKDVDPLRAPAVSVVNGRIVHFCSLTCRNEHLQRGKSSPPPAGVDSSKKQKTKIKEESQLPKEQPLKIVDAVLEQSPEVRSNFRSSRLRFQLVQTLVLGLLAAAIIILQPIIGTLPTIITAGIITLASSGLVLFKEARLNARRLLDASALPISALTIAGTVFLGANTRIASISIMALVLVQSLGRLLELLGRRRSGVLRAIEGVSEVSLSPSWSENSGMAARLKRVALVMDWARFPGAISIGAIVYLTQNVSIIGALLAFATALMVLSPRVLRMISGDAHLAAAYECASRGAIVRDARVIDQLASTRVVLFMDRETLLQEGLGVSDWQNGGDATDVSILSGLASIEAKATGRIAGAILKFAKEKGAVPAPVEDFEEEPGLGISANTPTSSVVCGSRLFLLGKGISTACYEETAVKIEATGRRALFVALDGEASAVFGIEESPVPDALSVNQQLRRMGLEPVMVTSAEVDAAHALGLRMGIENVRFQTAEDGMQVVLREIKDSGEGAILVGHGEAFEENLGLSSASIAIGNSISTQAGVDARSLGVSSIPWLVEFSKRAYRSTQVNMAAAVSAFILGLALCLSWFSPLIVVFAVGVCAGVSALCTLNAPYPLVSRLLTVVSSVKQKARKITNRGYKVK